MSNRKKYFIGSAVIIMIIIVTLIVANIPVKYPKSKPEYGNDHYYLELIDFYANNTGKKYVSVNTTWAGVRMMVDYNTSCINEDGYIHLVCSDGKVMMSLSVMSNSEVPATYIKGSNLKPFYSDTVPNDIPENSTWEIVWKFSGGPVRVVLERVIS